MLPTFTIFIQHSNGIPATAFRQEKEKSHPNWKEEGKYLQIVFSLGFEMGWEFIHIDAH